MKLNLTVILIFFAFGLVSQTDQLVTIKGVAPSYVGKTIFFNEIEDYFSLTESTHASATVKPDSTFSCSFLIKETQKIHVLPDINAGYMYIEPGGRYEIFIPEKDKYDPYRPLGNQIEIPFLSLSKEDINFKILEYQRWQDEFLGEYFPLKAVKPMEFAQKLELFKTNVEAYYKLNDTIITRTEPEQYFSTFVRFSIASLDNIQHAADRNRYEKHDFYIKFNPVAYKNDVYMNYINQFYEKQFSRLTMETNNRVYLGVLKSSPTLVMRALGNEYTLINIRLRELIMIKGLCEQFYTNEYPQTNIMTILDSVANHSLFESNGLIAKNMMDRLTQLVSGSKAPTFLLTNTSGTKTLEDFSGKHLYITFIDPSITKNLQEIDPLIKLYDQYKDIVQFITIIPESGALELLPKGIKWPTYQVDKSNSLWKNYNVKTFPYYLLLDAYGYVVAAPSLGPTPDGQYRTIDNTFFNLQKVLKKGAKNR